MRICAVTGSRADWGLLKPVLTRLQGSAAQVQLVVTGSHLDARFGHTVDDIQADGFTPDRRVALGLEGDDACAVATAMGNAVGGITAALHSLQPDVLLILGDRYEIFAAAQAALLLRIPVAHIAGGDITEGAYDDAIRHAITKLSHLHFTTNAQARRRVLQLGEAPSRVLDCGSPGIDALLETARWDRQQLQRALGFQLRPRNLAITFHPVTLDDAKPEAQLTPLLTALQALGDTTGLIFSGANADNGGQRINQLLQEFVRARDNTCFCVSLGQAGYYSLVEQADLVVGNSSSGLYEAPSLHTPTLDIGTRQQGRLRGPSVQHAPNEADAIGRMIESMLRHPPRDFSNPYGDGNASRCIADALLAIKDPRQLLIKHFVEAD